MAFSSETYAILQSKLKSVASGVKNVALTPDASGIIFTLNIDSYVS